METQANPIFNVTRGRVVCEHAIIADQPIRRLRGLLGRSSLPAGEGLLLQPAPSVHTAFMKFAIDVVFLDRDLQVIKLVESLRPWRAASARRARATLELASGQAAARGIEIGDRLGLVNGAAHHVPFQAAERPSVLLVSNDRRFRSVTAALLARRGCTVTLTDCLARAAELARREATDVVVIDVGSSLGAAARASAAIEALDPLVGAVLVGDEPGEDLAAPAVRAKWGSFDGLYAAIQHARVPPTRRSFR